MGASRVFCVALPFLLSAGSLVLLLAACFGNVTQKDLYVVRFNTTRLTSHLNDSELASIRRAPTLMLRQIDAAGSSSSINSTLLDLGSTYDISLWSYCISGDGERDCTNLSFDWASKLNATSFPIDAHQLNIFQRILWWTQVFYVVTALALALSLVFGIFANYTRAMSCVTFLVAQVVSVAAVTSASLSTIVAVTTVGAVDSPDWHGANASLNTAFLALSWMSVACALSAGFFWMFTICCCAPSRSRTR